MTGNTREQSPSDLDMLLVAVTPQKKRKFQDTETVQRINTEQLRMCAFYTRHLNVLLKCLGCLFFPQNMHVVKMNRKYIYVDAFNRGTGHPLCPFSSLSSFTHTLPCLPHLHPGACAQTPGKGRQRQVLLWGPSPTPSWALTS